MIFRGSIECNLCLALVQNLICNSFASFWFYFECVCVRFMNSMYFLYRYGSISGSVEQLKLQAAKTSGTPA